MLCCSKGQAPEGGVSCSGGSKTKALRMQGRWLAALANVSHKLYNPQRRLGPPSTINMATKLMSCDVQFNSLAACARARFCKLHGNGLWARGLHYVLQHTPFLDLKFIPMSRPCRNGSGDVAPRGVFGRARAHTSSNPNSSFVHAVSAGSFSIPLPAVRGEIGCCILTHGTD